MSIGYIRWRGSSPTEREAIVDRGQLPERDADQIRAGRERRLTLAEDIRKLEAVRDRLLAVDEVARTYPEGHHTRVLLENMRVERIVENLEKTSRSTTRSGRGRHERAIRRTTLSNRRK